MSDTKADSSRRRLREAQSDAMDANLAVEELTEILAVVKTHKPVHSPEARAYVVEYIEKTLGRTSAEAARRRSQADQIEFWGRR